jgi:thiamine-monophosphate kinase
LLSLTLSDAGDWEAEFIGGVGAACDTYGLSLIGGDTIALPTGAPRVLGMTAIGRARERVPDRSGGKPGDELWLVGTLGDAGAGLDQLRADENASGPLVEAYRRPVPLLTAGQALAPHAHAMMDVSDGLLLDVQRMAEASGCSAVIDHDSLPLSNAFKAARGDARDARLFAATAGDDYALLAALSVDFSTLCLPSGTTVTRLGRLAAGVGSLQLVSGGKPVTLPERLGHEHRGNSASPMADRT